MILTGSEIQREVEMGRINISPFEPKYLNPNSVNYRLGPILRFFGGVVLDPAIQGNWTSIEISSDGILLQPRILYLGSTIETIGSNFYVPSLIGRSSLGRLGMFLQVSADMGNLGAIHQWTLEITVVQPLRVYSGMVVGQVSFWRPHGEASLYTEGYEQFSGPAQTRHVNRHLARKQWNKS